MELAPTGEHCSAEWRAALEQLGAARETRAALERDAGPAPADPWPAVVANHLVHLAVRRVRLLADQLELRDGQLAGSWECR